jgi:ankyrin repeat protein
MHKVPSELDELDDVSLFDCVDAGDIDLLIELIELNGSNIWFSCGLHGLTLLHLAAMRGNSEILKELIKHDYDDDEKLIEEVDCYGYTPLHYAIKHGNFRCVKTLISSGADIKYRDRENRTYLHHAAQFYRYVPSKFHMSIIGNLISAGVDIGALDNNGETAIDISSKDKLKYLATLYIQTSKCMKDTEKKKITKKKKSIKKSVV